MRLNREALAYLEELTEKSAVQGQARPKLNIRFGDNPVSIRKCPLARFFYLKVLISVLL